jgi:hypothetical protein
MKLAKLELKYMPQVVELIENFVEVYKYKDKVDVKKMVNLIAAANMSPTWLTLCVLDGEKVIGGLLAKLDTLSFNYELVAMKQWMHVIPGPKAGLAFKQLLGALEQWADTKGCKTIAFNASFRSPRTGEFVEKFGYRPEAIWYTLEL